MILVVLLMVFINGLLVVMLGSIGVYGNVVIGGLGMVFIGDVFMFVLCVFVFFFNCNGVFCFGCFQFIDYEMGKFVVGCWVRVWLSGGWNVFDIMDVDGMIFWIECFIVEIFYIDLVQRCDV